jgi:isocitrate dehydrogenase
MASPTPITVAHGDGIGPEIMAAALHILKEAGANIAIEEIEIGEKVYLRGISAGIEPSAIESLTRTKVFLKAPITTPQGGGYKSLNVTARKMLGLYANVRPCVSYHPFVDTKHPVMDVVIVRENEEDTYGGIEHRQSDEVYQCLKLITRSGCERIVRYAFEYARANSRKKVTCFTKDNIMKLTDGQFHKVFDEIAPEYPEIANEHWIVDIGAAKLADTPEAFDVVVMPNLYGDILSDVAAQIAGSVGLAGSSNIGMKYAMFEAIHGSAPRRAGQNMANPSGLLLGAVMMMNHIGQPEVASRVHNAWLRTIEEGVHTYDIFKEGISKEKVGTKEFAQAVAARVGQLPEKLKPVSYKPFHMPKPQASIRSASKKERVGADIFVGWNQTPDGLAEVLQRAQADGLKLVMLSNRGTKVWPDGFPDTICTDVYRCRFQKDTGIVSGALVADQIARIEGQGLDVVKFESLYTFDGQPGFSLGQGQ